jgi:hypothetical protein
MKYVKNKCNEPIPFSEIVTETHMFVCLSPGSTKATSMREVMINEIVFATMVLESSPWLRTCSLIYSDDMLDYTLWC